MPKTLDTPARPPRVNLAAFAYRVSPEEWGEIVDRAKDDARKGDWRAREWLTRYVLAPARAARLSGLGVSAEDAALLANLHLPDNWQSPLSDGGSSA